MDRSALLRKSTTGELALQGSPGPVAQTVSPPRDTLIDTRRIAEVDLLRGLVIVLMVLDHVRDYFHADAFAFDPLDPAHTTPALYATRWITHLCAPTFVFLAGVSGWLQAARGKTPSSLSPFLLKRGLWLIALEVTVVSFGWAFSLPYLLLLQVIWAIGWSMVALAALVWLPRSAVLATGAGIVLLHNLLDPIDPSHLGAVSFLWVFLHEGGPVPATGHAVGFAFYPILPWVGLMAVGYGLGPLFLLDARRRGRALSALGVGLLATFVLLRGFQLYGEPEPWTPHETWAATVMSFLDVTKYPPSLHYALVTIGLVLAAWPVLTRLTGPARAVLITFGSVPFFVYLLHVYFVHTSAIVVNMAAGREIDGLLDAFRNWIFAPGQAQGLGFELSFVYAMWVLMLVLLYPLCRWFAALKGRRRDWWLSYL